MRMFPKIGKLFKKPYPKGSMRERASKALKGAGKYIAVGGALSLGAEGVSALVSKARGSPNMQDSEQVEFTDWGPSVFRVDSVDAAPKSKLSIITMLLICLAVCLCLCLPFLRILGTLIRHCRLNRAFKTTSPLCPPPLGPPTNNSDTASPEDPDEPLPSMESYWNSMNQTKFKAEEDQHEAENIKHKIEEEIMAREKADIGDVIEKIRGSVAVKAAERHHQEEEEKYQD